jgi:DNA-binding SARP family transcriptional activator
VLADGVPQPVSGLRRRAVLAVLGLTAGEVVSTDRLVDAAWDGRPPATYLNTLQSTISHLRSVLGGKAAIVARARGYLLDLDGDPTDVRVAERLIGEAQRAGDPTRKVAWLSDALALWRGRPLADVAGLSWLDSQAERLARVRLEAVQALNEARLSLGHHAQLVSELEQLTRENPYHESLYAQLMLALYRASRQAEALAAYQQLRRRLAEDLRADTSPPLRELEAAILRQDARLGPPATATVHVGRSRVPRQLPPDPAGFVGRVDALAELDARLAAGDVAISAISGTAGVGKTALAVHWAHAVADQFPDGQLYLNLRGFGPSGAPLDPADAIRGLLAGFGVQHAPTSPDALFRQLVADRRMLILLDNAADADQVRPLLPGSAGCHVIVTSRYQLPSLVAADGARPLGLELLSPAEAYDLLARRLGPARLAAEPAAVDAIVGAAARLPLALALLAARAALRPQLPLAALAAELRDPRAPLAGGESGADLRAVFNWSYRRLSPAAARLFRLLGHTSGPDITAPAAATLAGIHPSRVPLILDELAQAGLLSQPVAGRFALHGLLRAYALEQSERVDSLEQRAEATHRIAGQPEFQRRFRAGWHAHACRW